MQSNKIEIIRELEPIHVTATLQFVIPTPTESMHIMNKNLMGIQTTLMTHTKQLSKISSRVLEDIESIHSLEVLHDIRDKLNKRIRLQVVEASFLKIEDMARSLSVSKSFLEKNMGGENRDESDTKLLSKLLG